jgi:uncharacterized protein (DUF2147 family)
MTKSIVFALMLTVCGTAWAAGEKNAANGLWLTENHRSVIKIENCGDRLCGRIFWIIKGGMQTDSKNPDETRRSRPLCGLPLLWGFKADDATHWSGGHIYKADDGDTYHATIEALSPDRLKVRGYVGISLFGASQTWTRVGAAAYPRCKPAAH